MNAKRLFDPRCTAALAMTAALLAFPASPVPAQEARIATSYHSGTSGRGRRCTKSVTM